MASCSEISNGCRVAVINGRHFPSFSAGDEGTVLRVDTEARNCHVLFAAKSEAIVVALRHLRVVAPVGETPSTVGFTEDSSSSWSPMAYTSSLVQRQEASSVEAVCRSCNNTGIDFFSGKPCSCAAGEALQQQAGIKTSPPSQCAWEPHVEVLPPQTQAPHAVADFGCRGGGQLRHSSSGTELGRMDPPGVKPPPPHSAWEPNGEAKVAPHHQASPETPTAAQTDTPASEPVPSDATRASVTSAGAASATDVAWRAARHEALEARLASSEEEHRTEVAYLRHALEECVRAIGVCARGINAMCAAASETSGEWERAAAALNAAADLGSRALASNVSGPLQGSGSVPAFEGPLLSASASVPSWGFTVPAGGAASPSSASNLGLTSLAAAIPGLERRPSPLDCTPSPVATPSPTRHGPGVTAGPLMDNGTKACTAQAQRAAGTTMVAPQPQAAGGAQHHRHFLVAAPAAQQTAKAVAQTSNGLGGVASAGTGTPRMQPQMLSPVVPSPGLAAHGHAMVGRAQSPVPRGAPIPTWVACGGQPAGQQGAHPVGNPATLVAPAMVTAHAMLGGPATVAAPTFAAAHGCMTPPANLLGTMRGLPFLG